MEELVLCNCLVILIVPLCIALVTFDVTMRIIRGLDGIEMAVLALIYLDEKDIFQKNGCQS